MSVLKRLVRFVGHDGKTYLGDAILPKGVNDARKATEALPVTGDIFGSYQIGSSPVGIKKLLAPIPLDKVRTVRCLGLNYRKHAIETGHKFPEHPVLFYKPVTSLCGPADDIRVPPMAQIDETVDYEGELVVIIGKECRNVEPEQALNYVFGYAAGNDVSQRNWQLKGGGGQWATGKMFDTFAPYGPAVVTRAVIPDPAKLQLHTNINGEQFQNETTGDMIFSVPYAISFLSKGCTLLPGDVIFMGTPAGVAMKTGRWLKHGDVVEIGVSEVGTIVNQVIYEGGSSKL